MKDGIKQEIIEACATPIMMADKQPIAFTISEVIDIAISVMNKDKLRAAAPDMLYALIKAEAALDIQIQIFKEKKIVWSFGVETLNTIRTAIKKATE